MTKSKAKSKRPDRSPAASRDGSESDSSRMSSVPQSPVSSHGMHSSLLGTPGSGPSHSQHSGALSQMLQKPTATQWFITEIQQMMHGFGDCRRPLLESATIIEEIVHQQLRTVLTQATEVAAARNARFTSMEDFIFLLRKDKGKLRRLIIHIIQRSQSFGSVEQH